MEPASKNFSATELRCKCALCRQQIPNTVDLMALEALQRVRDRLGEPMPITSAYRCASHPVETKKSQPGQHNKGLAFDIAVPWGQKRMRIVELALDEGFRGFGFANSFLHIDRREGELTSWTYS